MLKSNKLNHNIKISFLKYIKNSFSYFFAYKIKFIITLIISIISIFAICFYIPVLRIDPFKSHIALLKENKINDLLLVENNLLFGRFQLVNNGNTFTNKQLETIKKHTKQKDLILVYQNFQTESPTHEKTSFFDYTENITFDIKEIKNDSYIDAYSFISKRNYSGLMKMDEKDLSYANFNLDERIVDKSKYHFPQNYEEIAISSLKAEMYVKEGFKDSNGTIIKLNSINGLIGRKLSSYTITAIYTNDEDVNISKNYELKRNDLNFNEALKNGTYISNLLIVKRGFVNDFSIKTNTEYNSSISVYYKNRSNNYNDLISLSKELKYRSFINEFNKHIEKRYDYFYDVSVASPVSEISNLASMTVYHLNFPLLTFLVCMAVLLNVFFYRSLLISANKNKKDLTLNTTQSSNDNLEFFTTNFIILPTISILILCLVSPFVLILLNHLNKLVLCQALNFHFLSFVYALLAIIGVILLSLILSIRKINKILNK